MKYRRTFLQFTLAILVLTFCSCDFIIEPKRIFNEDVKPLQIGTFEFNELSSGQHVDGIIYFEIKTDTIDFEIQAIQLFVDNGQASYADREPYILELNTRNFDEGLHKLVIQVYQEDKVHGVLNLTYPPSITLINELYFDRTPPEAVTLNVTKSEDGETGILNWSESTNENFAAYRIHRYYKYNEEEIIDTIYLKSQTSYLDKRVEKVYGMKVIYTVEVCTNRDFNYYQYTDFSNEDTIFYGKTLNYKDFGFGLSDIVLNEQTSEIYFIGDGKLLAYSGENQSLLRETSIPQIPSNSPSGHFTISIDGSKLFIFNPWENKITIIDAETFSIIKTITLEFDPSHGADETNIYHLGVNKVLIITTDSVLRIVDIESGAVIDSSFASSVTNFHSSVVTDDRSYLIISQSNNFNSDYKVVVRDLTLPGLPVISEKNTDDYYYKLKTSSDNQRLYGLGWNNNDIDVIDFSSLEIISSLSTPFGFNSLYLSNGKIYTSTYKQISFPEMTSLEGYEIISLNENTLEREKSWLTMSTWGDIAVLSDYIYIRSYITNIAGIAIPLDN